ncbi:hypothetical protein DdX_21368 [Ditylenchus destructor]|uniref:Uncharacterized protein n=1 Tax=Ditylenchus destructor TaxID=166010 RepID=A0AAD4MEZ0_9BILA|nr:hypothetical protein DdX_21368 [Ditylenchus destructor]
MEVKSIFIITVIFPSSTIAFGNWAYKEHSPGVARVSENQLDRIVDLGASAKKSGTVGLPSPRSTILSSWFSETRATPEIEAKKMRRLREKQTNPERVVQREPKAKKSRPKDKIPNIAIMDNGTMVEAFKFLKYCQLGKNSLVTKRFWNLIRSHRHKLALLDVYSITMERRFDNRAPAVIEMFDKELSPEKYNEWVVRNGYSKQIPLECQIAEYESSEYWRYIYGFSAYADQNTTNCHETATTVFYARVEFKDDTWPLCQHFVRLIMDPFIYIRSLSLDSLRDILSLLTEAMNPDRDRLQCEHLSIHINDDTQKFIVWIKDHMRCDEVSVNRHMNMYCDEELLDFFLSGAACTPAIHVTYHVLYDHSKIIVNLVQKFMGLKNRDEYQMVESIQNAEANGFSQGVVKKLKRDFAEFIDGNTRPGIGFINNDIDKKLTLIVKDFSYTRTSTASNFLQILPRNHRYISDAIKFNTGCDLVRNKNCKTRHKHRVHGTKRTTKIISNRDSINISFVELASTENDGGSAGGGERSQTWAEYSAKCDHDFKEAPRPSDFPEPPKVKYGETLEVKVTNFGQGFEYATYNIEINAVDGQDRLLVRAEGQKKLWIRYRACVHRAAIELSVDCNTRTITHVNLNIAELVWTAFQVYNAHSCKEQRKSGLCSLVCRKRACESRK